VGIVVAWDTLKTCVENKIKMVKHMFVSNNYLQVSVDNEEAILEYLNKLCCTKHDILFGVKILRRCLPMEILDVEANDDRDMGHVDVGRSSTL